MSSRSSAALFVVAACVLAFAPFLALLRGTVEPISWLRAVIAAFCAWGAASGGGWARWLGAALALWELREVGIAWRLSPAVRALVPQYSLWAFGNAVGAVVLIVAVVAWRSPRGAGSETP